MNHAALYGAGPHVCPGRGLSTADAYAAAGAVMCENMMLPDTDEGLTAFLEKRPPGWAQ